MIYLMYEEKQYLVIQEEHRIYKVKHMTCKNLINELCYMYGSTYEGNRQAICRYLQISKNAPILISFQLNIIFFPIHHSEKNSFWINYAYVENICKQDEHHLTIFMKCNFSICVQASYRGVYRQLQRCRMYLKMLEACDVQNFLDHMHSTQGCAYES